MMLPGLYSSEAAQQHHGGWAEVEGLPGLHLSEAEVESFRLMG